ncbi:MAG TPA: hypothetical protein VKG01_01935 [Thermoanaerobaculia bacterium]|nr:hypothetical protein [Thermoanaerobaculia bacterium]
MKVRIRLARIAGIPVFAALLFLPAGTARAGGGDILLVGANSFDDLDKSDGAHDGVFNVSGSLTLSPGASILCNDSGPSTASACPISIVVGGDLFMGDGSSILAENNFGGGSGGNIRIRVNGTLFDVGPGAVISSRKNAATDAAGAGGIFIAVGSLISLGGGGVSCNQDLGDVSVAPGALITSDGNGQAGAIGIFAGNSIAVGGTVRAQGLTTTGRGGAITLGACFGGLGTAASSVVSSRGGGPGADLVFLRGEVVEIHGLVESTGPGQQAPNGHNSCNAPGRPANSTACVQVISATSIDVETEAQINADTGFSGGTQGTGWIDFLSLGNIAIHGDLSLPFALHANQGLTNGHGGTILIRSIGGGNVTLTGRAIQANSTSGGGKGGNVTVEATFGTVDLGQAAVMAQGSQTGGGGQAGGRITVNAFLGDLNGSSPGEVNARGGLGPTTGTVSLNFCNDFNYTGGSTPSALVTQICAGPI